MTYMKRREQVCHMYGTLNWSFERIAEELGIAPASAWRIWTKAYANAGKEGVDKKRTNQVIKTERRIAELLERTRKPNISDKDFAATHAEITKASDLLAKLQGTYMPQRREVSVITDDVVNREIERLTEQMAGDPSVREPG
jgi:predicted transcriptional regulator